MEGLKINKKASKKLAHLQIITDYIEIVALGLKPAYLVDNCSVSVDDVVSLVEKSNLKPLQKCRVLVVDMDIFVVGMDDIKEKIRKLSTFDWLCHPFLLSIGVSDISIVEQTDLQQITTILQETIMSAVFASENILVSLHVTNELVSVVSLPFIAGWLLGYPCIYRADTAGALALSGIPLIKVSIPITRRSSPSPTSSSNTSSSYAAGTMNIMEFTVPQSMLLASNELTRVLFQDRIDTMAKNLTSAISRLISEQEFTFREMSPQAQYWKECFPNQIINPEIEILSSSHVIL